MMIIICRGSQGITVKCVMHVWPPSTASPYLHMSLNPPAASHDVAVTCHKQVFKPYWLDCGQMLCWGPADWPCRHLYHEGWRWVPAIQLACYPALTQLVKISIHQALKAQSSPLELLRLEVVTQLSVPGGLKGWLTGQRISGFPTGSILLNVIHYVITIFNLQTAACQSVFWSELLTDRRALEIKRPIYKLNRQSPLSYWSASCDDVVINLPFTHENSMRFLWEVTFNIHFLQIYMACYV